VNIKYVSFRLFLISGQQSDSFFFESLQLLVLFLLQLGNFGIDGNKSRLDSLQLEFELNLALLQKSALFAQLGQVGLQISVLDGFELVLQSSPFLEVVLDVADQVLFLDDGFDLLNY
jgi:hypothetical protein